MKRFERESRLKREWEQQKFNKYHGINLYVKHIEDEVDEEALKKEFSAFGEVKSCKIPLDEKGSSKGFGFVCFSTPEEAQKAIVGLNSKILQGCKKPLFVALHESKEVRKQKLAHRHNLAMTKNIRGVQQQMYSPQGQAMFILMLMEVDLITLNKSCQCNKEDGLLDLNNSKLCLTTTSLE
jgi:polyadenylate-binding protein